jgi:hypothetical protein
MPMNSVGMRGPLDTVEVATSATREHYDHGVHNISHTTWLLSIYHMQGDGLGSMNTPLPNFLYM